MKKLSIILLLGLMLSYSVNAQILYNEYTTYNPYYGKSKIYNNNKQDKRFELGVIIIGIGLITMLASTYSYNQNYYGFVKQTNYPMFFTGLGLTTVGLVISLDNSKRNKRTRDVYYK